MTDFGGVYGGRVYVPWQGKRIWISKDRHGFKIQTDDHAKAVLREIRVDHFRGVFDPADWGKDKTLLVPNAWAVYLSQHTGRESTKRELVLRYDKYIEPYFGQMTLKELDEHHVGDWFSKLPDDLKPSYRRTILSTLKAFLESHKVTRRKAIKYPVQKVPQEKPESLTQDEQSKVLEALASHHRPIFRFLMSYGTRVSEAVNLPWSDIDRKKKTVTLRGRKNGKDLILPLEEGLVGGQASRLCRDGLLPTVAYPQNSCNGEVLPSFNVAPAPTNFFYVFSTRQGKQYNRMSLDNLWHEASARAGVKQVPLKNGTRHSLAYRMLSRGETHYTVSEVLGNSPATVAKSYGSISLERKAEALFGSPILKGKEGNAIR